MNSDITEFEGMSKRDFISGFNKDRKGFEENGGDPADYDQFLNWAKVQKLERIHVDLMNLVRCFKKG